MPFISLQWPIDIIKNAIFVTRQVKTGNFGLLGAIKIRGMDFYATIRPLIDHQELLGLHICGFKLFTR